MQDQTDADKGSVLALVVELDLYIRALQQSLLGERHTVHFVLALRHFVDGGGLPAGRVTRALAVVKCRGSAHDNHILPMTIGAHGVEVEGAPSGADG